MPARPAQRVGCPHCLRPQNACICHWVCRIEHQVEVLVLQHPLEVHHPKGSARLLHLCLPHSRLFSGEIFDPAELQHHLRAPWGHAPAPQLSVLLYPNTASDPALPAPPELPPEALTEPARIRLVVLDGTWRKSRKMLYCNPLLQPLPRLSLQGLPPSHYRVRKAHRPDQLSTLEAVAYALAQLEQDEAKYAPLLAAFDGFIGQLAQHWPTPPTPPTSTT